MTPIPLSKTAAELLDLVSRARFEMSRWCSDGDTIHSNDSRDRRSTPANKKTVRGTEVDDS